MPMRYKPVVIQACFMQVVFVQILRPILLRPPFGGAGRSLLERSREECQRQSQAGHNHRRLLKCEVLLRLLLAC
jgi:hypothetical protein